MAAIEFAVPQELTKLENSDPEPRADDCALGPRRRIPLLSVSPDENDHNALLQIVDQLPFLVTAAWTCREAFRCLNMESFGIVLCECKLPDGNWIEILNRTSAAPEPPLRHRHFQARRRIAMGGSLEPRRLRPSGQTFQPPGGAARTHLRVGAEGESGRSNVRGWGCLTAHRLRTLRQCVPYSPAGTGQRLH